MELTDEVYDKIVALSEKGDEYADKEQFTSALKQYGEALALLPEPKTDWEAATWLYVAMGDAYYNKQQLAQAMNAYQKAMMSPEGTGNAYIWFCIGQIFYEESNYEKAKTHFMSAYLLDGDEIFENENPEYLKLIKEETEKIAEKPQQEDQQSEKKNPWKLPPDWNEN